MARIKKLIGIVSAAAISTFAGLAVETVAAAPAQAQCAFGGFGGFGGGFCDTDFAPDGSYNHCVTVSAFGYGGTCDRVCPPAAGGIIPGPYTGRC